MNPTIQTILERRSIRAYEPRPVDRDDLEQILQAGQHAPTGGGVQGWRFVVVNDEGFRRKLAELAAPRYREWMKNAPDGLKALREKIDAAVDDPVFYDAPSIVYVIGRGMSADYDCAMVCQNMMLAAKSLGLGSCWVYFGQLVLDDAKVRQALELQEGEKVYGPILIGHTAPDQPLVMPRQEPTVKWI